MKSLFSSPSAAKQLIKPLQQIPRRSFAATVPCLSQRSSSTSGQAIPLGPYYELILNEPPPYPEEKPEEPPTSSTVVDAPRPSPEKPKTTRGRKPKDDKPPSPATSSRKQKSSVLAPPPSQETSPPIPTPPPSSAEAQARVIFGSRLQGPAERAERLAEQRKRSSLVAGVLVPPRPNEPDNCCMSGCVNCVWDRYREEMEEWASAHAEAERRLRSQEAGTASASAAGPSTELAGVSMDDDGGGSDSNWGPVSDDGKIAKDLWDEDLYKNLPVGIREFIKQEKRLKLKHQREGTTGG